MDILVLNGSPRADGNTAALVQAALQGMQADVQVHIENLYELLPMPCTACGCCRESNVCMFSDLDETARLLQQADALVWALPVYNYSLPAPVKALTDRLQRYYEASVRGETVFADSRRPSLLLLSAGRSGLYAVDIINRQLATANRYIGFLAPQTVFAANTDLSPVQEDILHEAAQAGRQLCLAVGRNREKYL